MRQFRAKESSARSLRNLTSCRNVRRVPRNYELMVLADVSGSKSVYFPSVSRLSCRDKLITLYGLNMPAGIQVGLAWVCR